MDIAICQSPQRIGASVLSELGGTPEPGRRPWIPSFVHYRFRYLP